MIPSCSKVNVSGEPEVYVCMLDDLAYPLMPFLIKEYTNGAKICKSFGRLKTRFAKRDGHRPKTHTSCYPQLLYSIILYTNRNLWFSRNNHFRFCHAFTGLCIYLHIIFLSCTSTDCRDFR